MFPYQKVRQGSKIVLYAAGKVGKAFFHQLQKTRYCELSAWVDKKETIYKGQVIVAPENAVWKDTDYIVIAIEDETIAKKIKRELVVKYNVTSDRLIWVNPII